MPEMMEEVQEFESTTVGVYRTAATVKGGRRFSFSALVVVGDRGGRVGVGYGKANQVPSAIEKGQKEARRKAISYPMQGRTLPHAVTGRYGACVVRLIPASPGTGVIAGAAVRAVLEMMGVQDCLTKSFGSTNPKNLVKAVLDGLSRLRSKHEVEDLRGVSLEKTTVEESIERSRAFMREPSEKAAAPAPAAKSPDKKREKSRKRERGKRGGDREGRRRSGAKKTTEASQTARPAEGKKTHPSVPPKAAEQTESEQRQVGQSEGLPEAMPAFPPEGDPKHDTAARDDAPKP